MTIDVVSTTFPNWTRLEAPSRAKPYWHELDGTPRTVTDLTSGAAATIVEAVERMHWGAIAELAEGAFDERRAGSFAEARRLAHAASLLCGEISGLVTASNHRS